MRSRLSPSGPSLPWCTHDCGWGHKGCGRGREREGDDDDDASSEGRERAAKISYSPPHSLAVRTTPTSNLQPARPGPRGLKNGPSPVIKNWYMLGRMESGGGALRLAYTQIHTLPRSKCYESSAALYIVCSWMWQY